MIDRRSLIPIAVFLAIVLVGGGLWSLRPRVTDFLPAADSTNQPERTPIRITFNRAMDHDQVASRLTITPRTPGQITWEGNTLVFTPDSDWAHGELVSVTLNRGARSRLFLPTTLTTQWDFTIVRTRLAFLWPLEGPTDLYALDLTTGESQQFTRLGTLIDFDVDEQTGLIFYSAENSEGGSDLYRYDWRAAASQVVLPCGPSRCADVSVAPGGALIAYTRIEEGAGALSAVWTLDLANSTATRVSGLGNEALLPLWSSQSVLAYYDYELRAFFFYSPSDQSRIRWYNQNGAAGAWSPNGVNFVAPESFEVTTNVLRGPSGEAENSDAAPEDLQPVVILSTHLFSFNLVNRRALDLSLDELVEDLAPSFSPDGIQIAFARRSIQEGSSPLGRQLWVMGRDGAAPVQLTDNPPYKYNQFSWHPGGETIAFVRFNNVELTAPPEVWVIEASTGVGTRLVIGAYAPAWIP
jgi:hypothetical protein